MITEVNIQEQKTRFIELLKCIDRQGMEELIAFLEKSTFFTDPASARYHGSFEGGLAAHSLAVYEELVLLEGNSDKVKIVALLHDICKTGTYEVQMRNVKNEAGKWEQVPYYQAVGSKFPYGHGEKSVYMIQNFIKITQEEALAIRWHMGSYEAKEQWGDLGAAQELYPLVMHTHFADVKASRTKA